MSHTMAGPYWEQFIEAMESEINDLEKHGTWIEVDKTSMPEGENLLPTTWAYKVKRYPDGRLRKFKSRFVARGDRQIEGVDYEDKYAPVVAWSTVRLVMTLSIHLGWETRQIDFGNAFVQADLNEDVYLNLPPGFTGEHGDRQNRVLKLKKSLYGLVQAPKTWYDHLSEALNRLGYQSSQNDSCMFMGNELILLVYVDDILVFGPSDTLIDKALEDLKIEKMEFTEESDVYAFLGVQVDKGESTGEITLTQTGLIDKIIKATGLEDANQKHTPAVAVPLSADLDGESYREEWNYASVIGMMMYLASNSRPDIQFAVHQCARFTHMPKKSHSEGVKRIVRYLLGTRECGLTFLPDSNMKLDCYVDADYAGLWKYEDDQDPVSVKSRTGYVMTLGKCPLIWSSKLQTEIALSTLEAEYIAMSQSMRELIPLRRLLEELGKTLELDFTKPVLIHSTVFEDNNGALGLAESPKLTPRTKHIGIKYHWFRDKIGKDRGIELAKIASVDQKADIFTKGLTEETFRVIRKLLMGW